MMIHHDELESQNAAQIFRNATILVCVMKNHRGGFSLAAVFRSHLVAAEVRMAVERSHSSAKCGRAILNE